MKIQAHGIKIALAKKHNRDFFLTEVPDGPSGSPRIDALSIRKSWVNPCVDGYEIKVSRNDFLSDDKWHLYLGMCNKFFFACPKGLIKREEITDPNVGLIYYNHETKSLRIVKKPIYKKQDISPTTLMHIIMWKLDNDRIPFYNNNTEYFEKWLQNKIKTRHLAWDVRSKLVSKLADYEDKVKSHERVILH